MIPYPVVSSIRSIASLNPSAPTLYPQPRVFPFQNMRRSPPKAKFLPAGIEEHIAIRVTPKHNSLPDLFRRNRRPKPRRPVNDRPPQIPEKRELLLPSSSCRQLRRLQKKEALSQKGRTWRTPAW